MSDNSISIVPRISMYPGKEQKAGEILHWLISRDIVKPNKTDCVLGGSGEGGYAISNGAIAITYYLDDVPLKLWTNGLDIITERHFFHTGGNGVESIICPRCKKDLVDEEWTFIEEWANKITDIVTCPLCQQTSNIYLQSCHGI